MVDVNRKECSSKSRGVWALVSLLLPAIGCASLGGEPEGHAGAIGGSAGSGTTVVFVAAGAPALGGAPSSTGGASGTDTGANRGGATVKASSFGGERSGGAANGGASDRAPSTIDGKSGGASLGGSGGTTRGVGSGGKSASGGAVVGKGGTLAVGGKSAVGGSTVGGSSITATGGCLDGPGVVVPAGYQLAWADEFNVDGRPDASNWSYETGFVRNEEAQWYQSDNASVDKGCLIIEGRKERKLNPNYQAGSSSWKTNRQYAEYTSSSLRTMGKQTWQYGRFEMRGRIKTQAGLWPAWWTLGESKEWPSCGEIDIMEYYANNIRANIACGTATRWQAKWDGAAWNVSTFEDKNWDSAFHVWKMDWDDQKISLYLDDKLVNTANLSDLLNSDGSSPFKQPHYMLLNLAIGGNNGGDPSKTSFPSRMEVDYVRVFKKL